MLLLDTNHSHGAAQEFLLQTFAKLFGATEENRWLETGVHFVYDAVRVFCVFLLVMLLVSFLKTYIPMERVREKLRGVPRLAGILFAALAGVFSSTCICTNVPLFIAFVSFGVPLSFAMTFLISASLINVASVVSMAALTGMKFTGVYLAASVAVILLAGLAVSFFSSAKNLAGALDPAREEDLADAGCLHCQAEHGHSAHDRHPDAHSHHLPFGAPQVHTLKTRLQTAWRETVHTLGDQWGYLLLGVAISALISGFVDLTFAQKIADFGFVGTLAVTAAGLVLHTDIISVLPAAASLSGMGVPFGILIPLISSLSFFSLPMVLMVRKTVKTAYIIKVWAVMFGLILLSGGLLLLLF